MSRGASTRRAAIIAASLGLVLATAAVYFPVGDFEFVSYDDSEYVANNAMVQRGLSLAGLRRAFSEPHHSNWHPLTTLSYMLDCEVFGVAPGAQHRVNVALHVVNTLLLFFLLLQTTGALARSAAVAALFALHPLHVESVAWISERKDVLSTFFGLAAALAYVGYVRSPRAGRYALVFLLFALGLLAKPMLVTWPFVLLLLDVWPLRRFEPHSAAGRSQAAPGDRPAARVRRAVAEKLPMLALSAVASALTVWAQAAGGALKSSELHPLAERIPNALLAYAQYLRKTLWPADLGVLYPFPERFPAWEVVASAAVLTAVTVACLRLRRRHPYLIVGWLWYLGTLVPVIGIVQVGAHAYADRYTYIPLIGIFIAAVWGFAEALSSRRRLAGAAAALTLGVLVLLAVVAWRQVAVWKDSVSLYSHTLRVTEKNAVIHNNLGIALVDRGRYDEAIRVYEEGLSFPSNFAHVLSYNAGVAYSRQGRQREALALFEQALRIDPAYAEALFHKALALRELGQLDAARRALERVIELAPEQADPHVKLGLVLGQLGRLSEAKRHFERALVLDPLDVDARINLAIAHLKTGDPEAAIEQLERVLREQPAHEAARRYLEAARARRSERGAAGEPHSPGGSEG